MTLARRAWAEVVYQGKDISTDLQPYLLGVTYTDNRGGKADEVTITLQDRDALWRGPWMPGAGDRIEVRIHADEWGEGGGVLACGTFTVDKLELAGPPATVRLSGVSVPPGLAARKTKRSRAWENTSLQTIAADVAASARMTLVWDVAAAQDPGIIDRLDQRSETDLGFLARVCEVYRLACKVYADQIVIWDVTSYEGRAPVTSYTLGESRVRSWTLAVKAYLYTPKVKVQYQDPWQGVVQESTRTAAQELREPDPDDPLGLAPQSFDDEAAEVIRVRARSKAEAEAKAKAALLARTEHNVEGSITVVGDVRLVAGNSIRLAGWNKLDGQYLVDRAVHTLGSGYTVQADVKRTAA